MPPDLVKRMVELVKSRTFKRLAIGISLTVVLALAVLWFRFWQLTGWMMEQQSQSAEIHVANVAENLYAVDFSLGDRQIGATSLALVGDEGVLIVDPPMTEALWELLRKALDSMEAGPVRILVNTHGHPDHAGGNRFFASDVEKIAHNRTSERLGERVKPFPLLPAVPAAPSHALPSTTIGAAATREFSGERIRLLPLGPGHTDGDVVVYFEHANVVHVGDLFHGRGGRAASDHKNSGGSSSLLAEGLEVILDATPPNATVVGGHGGISKTWTMADVDEYRRLHSAVASDVLARIRQGWTVEEVVSAGVADRWLPWFAEARSDSVMHGSPAGWLRNLYDNLKAKE